MGGWATSPLPTRGSPTVHSGGRKYPTSGQIGYVTDAVWGVHNIVERGTKSAVAHNWADLLCHPCNLGGSSSPSDRGTKTKVAHKWANRLCPPLWGVPNASEHWPRAPWRARGPQRLGLGDTMSGGPEVGRLATSRLPSGVVPNASHRGTKSLLAHKWADWLCHLCRVGHPQRFISGNKISCGPQVASLATSPLPFEPNGSHQVRK